VCKVCRCAKRQEYALAHPEKVAADKAAWSRTRKGKAANRRSYEKNREATNARIRQRYADNPNKILSKLSAWRIRNPEKAQAIIDRGNAKRAERLANCPINDFTRTDWLLMLAAFEYLCAYCGKNDRCLEMDHVIPLSKGGSHTAPNIVPACRSCNAKKGAKILT
jgi:5-methylcytosine-specific restriction endonuclease McrA